MSGKPKTKRKECKHCGCEIDFGMYCEACVSSERVCQMCGVDISHRKSNAFTCDIEGKSCQKTRQRRVKALKSKVDKSVHVHDVHVETEQPERSQDTNEKLLQTLLKWALENEQRQARLLDFLELQGLGGFSTGQANGQTATDFGINPPVPKPYIPTFDDDELPKVKAVKAEKAVNTGQNFLNSIMALNG